jgi:signal transduction histidine kinase
MRLSIRIKVILAVALSLIIIFGLVMYILLDKSTGQLRNDLNRESKTFASLAASPIGNSFILYQSSGTYQINQEVNNYLDLDSDVTEVSVVSVSGKVLFSSQSPANVHLSEQTASSFQPVYQSQHGYIEQIVQPLVEQGGVHRYAIVYEISTSRVQHNVDSVARIIVATGLAVLLISIGVTTYMLNRLFVKPIRDLSRSADLISNGNYETQIVAKDNDEIGVLATSLNKMASALKSDIVKLQDLDKMKSEFMMIASHNLRTPLSIITGYIDLGHDAKSPEEFKEIITTITEGVSRLHAISENMLTIASLETGSIMRMEPTKVKPFVDSICNEFEGIATKQGRSWHCTNSVSSDVELNINQASLRSALSSVIDNAIKFSHSGDQINIDASVVEGIFRFTVRDGGIGIDPAEMPKLFTKFHRGTDTMRYDYDGLGIGLYLSKLILDQHGGKIEIDSQKDQGTTCVISIPITGAGSA